MHFRRWQIALFALAAPLLAPDRVSACGPSPTPFYSVTSQSPSGAGAPINAPVLLQVTPVAIAGDALPLLPILYLGRVGSQEEETIEWHGGDAGAGQELSFVPSRDLEPSTTYEATFYSGQESSDSDIPAPPTATWQFTTGAQTAPTLSLEGALEVTLEPGQDRALECENMCSGCTATGALFPIIHARVKLPRPEGGFGVRRGELMLTDNVPYVFDPAPGSEPDTHEVSLGGQVNLDEPEGLEMVLSLPGEATTYHPCFAFRAFDARGDIVPVEPLCLTEEVPVATPPEPEPTAGPTSNPASDAGRHRSSSACSFQAGPARGSASWAGALLAVTAFTRRRRSRR